MEFAGELAGVIGIVESVIIDGRGGSQAVGNEGDREEDDGW